jgi:hypothetical protein
MKDIVRLKQQVQAAWAKLPKDVQAHLEGKMRAATIQAEAVQTEAVGTVADTQPDRELVMLHRVLNEDVETLGPAAVVPEGILTYVKKDGEVAFGGRDYDATDPGWAYCLVAMVETLDSTPAFKVGNEIKIDDNKTLGILGDWGGANAPALSVGNVAAEKSDYLIHLGDVYYAGTNGNGGSLDPEQQTNFLNVWPGKAGKSFALNSNHDMYAHATGYATALASPVFQAQGGNCFALYNDAFRIVGLDSAYYAPDSKLTDFPGYMIGSLGDAQGDQMHFLAGQIAKLKPGQKLVLLSHHNGLNVDGSLPQPSDPGFLLWQQVIGVLKLLPAAASKNVLWYWGHVHAGAVYKPQTVNGITISPRCCGHGCIPWGLASELAQSGHVIWYEKQNMGPGGNYFVTNGYAKLTLNGASLTEAFCNQQGAVSWTKPWP